MTYVFLCYNHYSVIMHKKHFGKIMILESTAKQCMYKVSINKL